MNEASASELRFTAAALAVLALSATRALQWFSTTSVPPGALAAGIGNPAENVRSNIVERGVRRLAVLRDWIPPTGLIGFVTSVESSESGPGKPRDLVDAYTRFWIARYALAPRRVVIDLKPRWIVADFRASDPAPTFPARLCIVPVRDFGDGLILFENRKAPVEDPR